MSLEFILAGSIILILIIFLPLLFVLTKELGPNSKGNKAKNLPYESGITQTIGTSSNPFSIKFYLVAILFVLFDVEIIFLLPWAINVRELGMFGIFEMFIFMFLLLSGLIYIYKIKALKWQ
jgi:NADH-quinone oxidoreductase subunit A